MPFVAKVEPVDNNLWDATAEFVSANNTVLIVVYVFFMCFCIWGAIKTSRKR